MKTIRFSSVTIFIVLILMLSGSLVFADGGATSVNWYAQYYDNPHLEGAAVLTTHETGLDHNWGAAAPAAGIPADDFSVRWTGNASFSAGDYSFSATTDDGVRVWIDGELIIDQWHEQAATTHSVQKTVSDGPHVIQMAYYERGGDASAKLDWALVAPAPTPSATNWDAEYFDNASLLGAPAQTQTETALNHDWGTDAPLAGIPADNFSVRWTSNVDFAAGVYRFDATTDDGVRVWIDGELIIDQWHEQAVTTHHAQKTLTGGVHRVQMAYFEASGFAVAKLDWQLDGAAPPVTPPASGDEILVDNLDAGFLWGGLWKYRHTAPGGQAHSYFWTQNATYLPENYAKWTPTFAHGGNYDVWIYIPSFQNATTNLRYRILHAGARSDVIVSQAAKNGSWVNLGTYNFNGDNIGKEFVLVYDNTHEYYASRIIAFDAVKLIAK